MMRMTCAAIALALCAPAWAAAQQPADTLPLVHAPILVRAAAPAFALGAPRPVATLSGTDLTGGRAAVFMEEAVQALPGLQIQNRYNFAVGERLSVRGFGGRAQFGVRGVRIMVDGVPATLPDGQSTLDHLDVATLGRVEVMRGPGAALYGNAAGGVVHFETRAPARELLRPELFTLAGSDGLSQLRGTASGTAGGIGYLVSAARVEYDGFRRNPVTTTDDHDTYGAALRSSVNATLHVPGGPGRLRVVINALDLAAENPGSISKIQFDTAHHTAFANNVRQRTRKDVRQAQLGLSWDGLLAGARAEFAAYGLGRTVDNPIPSDIVALERDAFGARGLVDIPGTLRGRPIAVGAGVELDLQRDDRQNYGNTAGERGALRLDQLERVRGLGLFTYLRFAPETRASVSAGVRYDSFDFEVDDRFRGTDPDDSGARSMSAVSPSVGVTIQAATRVELFGSLTSSFETPSTTELANRPEGAGGFNPTLDPQRGTTAEAGVRMQLHRSALIELTGHHTALRDELVPFEVQGVAGRTFFANAGRSRHRGIEAAFHAAAGRVLSTRVAYTYLDAEFETYRRGTATFDGNRIPGLAPHTFDAVIRSTHQTAFAEVRGQYRAAVPVDDANTAEAKPFFLLDLRAGGAALRLGPVELEPVAGVNNVLYRRYVAAVAVNAFGGRFFEPGPGRTAYLGIRAAAPWDR